MDWYLSRLDFFIYHIYSLIYFSYLDDLKLSRKMLTMKNRCHG